MDVLVVDSEVIQNYQNMVNDMGALVKQLINRVEEQDLDVWLTSDEAAKYLKVSVRTLERYQEEIGFSQPKGKEKKFMKRACYNWLMKYYFEVKPSHKRHYK